MTDTPTNKQENITAEQMEVLGEVASEMSLLAFATDSEDEVYGRKFEAVRAALHTLRKLPVTADGVIMLPGELVYTQGAGYAVVPGCVGSGAPIQTTRGAVVRVSNCYSTEQAAREAVKQERH